MNLVKHAEHSRYEQGRQNGSNNGVVSLVYTSDETYDLKNGEKMYSGILKGKKIKVLSYDASANFKYNNGVNFNFRDGEVKIKKSIMNLLALPPHDISDNREARRNYVVENCKLIIRDHRIDFRDDLEQMSYRNLYRLAIKLFMENVFLPLVFISPSIITQYKVKHRFKHIPDGLHLNAGFFVKDLLKKYVVPDERHQIFLDPDYRRNEPHEHKEVTISDVTHDVGTLTGDKNDYVDKNEKRSSYEHILRIIREYLKQNAPEQVPTYTKKNKLYFYQNYIHNILDLLVADRCHTLFFEDPSITNYNLCYLPLPCLNKMTKTCKLVEMRTKLQEMMRQIDSKYPFIWIDIALSPDDLLRNPMSYNRLIPSSILSQLTALIQGLYNENKFVNLSRNQNNNLLKVTNKLNRVSEFDFEVWIYTNTDYSTYDNKVMRVMYKKINHDNENETEPRKRKLDNNNIENRSKRVCVRNSINIMNSPIVSETNIDINSETDSLFDSETDSLFDSESDSQSLVDSQSLDSENDSQYQSETESETNSDSSYYPSSSDESSSCSDLSSLCESDDEICQQKTS